MGKTKTALAVLLILALTLSGLFSAKPVSAADTKLNKSNVEVDTDERMSLKIKSSYEAQYYWTYVQRLDGAQGQYAYYGDAYTYEEKGNGKFSYVFYEGGTFRVTIGLYDKDYYEHSASCTVTVRAVGPTKRNIAVIK
ncbi:MAG: hypothetical protein IKP68_01900, partial [Clostridia bacterium]|nr:hypothetical protein [Clostridia bacterium]